MPKLNECLVSVDLALALREVAKAMHIKIPRGNLQFRCPECNYPVKPHAEGEGPDGIDEPHFEHLSGYPKKCKYRHHSAKNK
jgi:hypothetical protein